MPELVECLLCGHKAVTLAKHFKPSHGLTCGEYRLLYPGAPVRGSDHAFQPRLEEAPRLRGKRKKRFTGLQLDEDGKLILDGLTEGYHYRHCAACGYVAEDLRDHLTRCRWVWWEGEGRVRLMTQADTRPSVEDLEDSYMAVFEEPLQSKYLELLGQRALKGRTLSPETKAKMSANAGRWNKGLTKETDARMATLSEHRKGQPSWSKGLTKADHPSLQQTSEKLSRLRTGVPNDAVRLDLAMVDFTPYLDETGAVDRKSMAEDLGISEPTVTKYMGKIGIRLSTKYVDARVERQVIRLEKEDLLPFALQNGKIVVAQAMVFLGRDYKVIKRECLRHGLETFTHRIRQTLCLNALAKVLGGATYTQEWESMKFLNPVSGRRFRFDGYFVDYSLVCEFHGWQHWVFPSVYIKDLGAFQAMQERDRVKELLIRDDPELRYLAIREDEPYTDPDYLLSRLIDEGIFDPGK